MLALAFTTAFTRACASTPSPDAVVRRLPPPGAAIVIVEPDVKLALLAVNARKTAKPDWSATARDHIALHARTKVAGRKRQALALSRSGASAKARQVLLLHDALRASVRTAETGDPAPAAMRHDREWRLGVGARSLAAGGAAPQALIITCDGDFTSALRAVFVVGAAAAGVLAPTGLTRASASPLDLDSGDIVLKNSIVASPEARRRWLAHCRTAPSVIARRTFLFTAFAAAAGASMRDPAPGVYRVGDDSIVQIDHVWSDFTRSGARKLRLLSQNGPTLDRLYLVGGLKPGEGLTNRPRGAGVVKSDSTAEDLHAFIVVSVDALGFTTSVLSNHRPAPLAAADGWRVDIATATSDGLALSGAEPYAQKADRLSAILCLVKTEQYFADGWHLVEAIMASATLD